ncbi:Protein kinase-like domain containing protein [Amanita muscaria]
MYSQTHHGLKKLMHIQRDCAYRRKIFRSKANPSRASNYPRMQLAQHVSSYGAFLAEPNICICMEYMDKGSFDGIYKKIGAIDIAVVSKLALSVLEGLTCLYDVHRIIHRDIKLSNILCNSQGEIKLCDFGVSGELINSIAHTFVGTSIYTSVSTNVKL